MALDRDAVRHIATLARIEVHDSELDPLAAEISNILKFIEQLGEVNTEGVAAMTSVAKMEMTLRADKVTDGNRPEDVLGNAPDRNDGFFGVPKVVE